MMMMQLLLLLLLFSHRRRRSRCRLMMSLDSILDVVDAGFPGFPVPAASKLGRNDVQDGGLEGLEVVVWDLSSLVLLLQVVKLCLENCWLVKDVDGDVQSGQHTLGVGDEHGVGRVITMHPLEEVTSVMCLSKGCSPDGLSECFPVSSGAVSSAPFVPDLQCGQFVAVGRQSGGDEGEQDNEGLHFQDKFQPQGYNLCV